MPFTAAPKLYTQPGHPCPALAWESKRTSAHPLPFIQIVFTWTCGDVPSSLILNLSKEPQTSQSIWKWNYPDVFADVTNGQQDANAKKISSPHMGVSVCKWDQEKKKAQCTLIPDERDFSLTPWLEFHCLKILNIQNLNFLQRLIFGGYLTVISFGGKEEKEVLPWQSSS